MLGKKLEYELFSILLRIYSPCEFDYYHSKLIHKWIFRCQFLWYLARLSNTLLVKIRSIKSDHFHCFPPERLRRRYSCFHFFRWLASNNIHNISVNSFAFTDNLEGLYVCIYNSSVNYQFKRNFLSTSIKGECRLFGPQEN